jgi:hypothetical protein
VGAAVSGWVGAPALTLRGRAHARVTAHRDPIPPRLPRRGRTPLSVPRTAQTSQSTERRRTLTIVTA